MKKTNNKKVRCIETGEVFLTVKEAAEATGVKPCTMSRHLHGARETCGKKKYHFEFLTEEISNG